MINKQTIKPKKERKKDMLLSHSSTQHHADRDASVIESDGSGRMYVNCHSPTLR